MKTLFALASSLIAVATSSPALAACEDLADFAIEDGTITSAQIVSEGAFTAPGGFGPPPGVAASPFADVPSFCRVQLTLTPSADSDIRSEVWLPLDGWNGKYVGVGNGVWAGSISHSELGNNVRRNYATAATDTGHVGSGMDASWAIGRPEKLVDFGYRAVHVTTVAAKAVIEEFYGRGPDVSIWNSCSTGGRQGLMAAHRYPEDFDAISSMAPANPMTDLMTQSMWQGWQPIRFGTQVTPAHLGLVHSAILEQCDAQDGVEDGIISRPLQCRPDLQRLQCTPGASEGCLSPDQMNVVYNLFGGTRADDGTALLPGWPYGSEGQMAALIMGSEPFPVAMSYFRDLVYAGRSDWDWATTDYRDYMMDGRAYGADILNVPPNGLAEFFSRGGRLLLSHGWADGLIPATNTLQFHHDLYSSLPAEQRENQLRLFFAPGMGHCSGGDGPSQFDTLGTVDDWVRTGQAPQRIIATRPTQAGGGFGGPPAPPRAPMERPLCPWPTEAIYDGSGDTALASSFSCGLRR